MTAGGTISRCSLDVVIADDRGRAWLCAAPFSGKFSNITHEDIVSVLRQANIPVTADADARIDSYLKFFSRTPHEPARDVPQRYLIATGRLPREPREAEIRFDGANQGATEASGAIRFVVAKAGQTVGSWIDAIDGEAGVDVFGDPVPPKSALRDVRIGAGLRLGSDRRITAERDGCVLRVGDEWSVVDVAEFAPNHMVGLVVESPAHSRVTGDLPETAELRTPHSARIDGAVEGGSVSAGEHVVVCGGVLGRGDQGRIVAGGSVHCRFCDGATIEAGGDIEIDNEAVNANLRARGAIRVCSGGIVGGCAHANGGGEIETAGNDAMIPTQISIGVPAEMLIEARQLDDEARQIQHSLEPIQARSQPLVTNLKRLTAVQKEQLIGLLQETKQINGRLEESRQRAAAMHEAISGIGHARLHIRGMLHAGVRFRVGLREASVRTNFRGPLTLESRIVHGATELVISFESGRSQVLSSTEVLLESPLHGEHSKRRL